MDWKWFKNKRYIMVEKYMIQDLLSLSSDLGLTQTCLVLNANFAQITLKTSFINKNHLNHRKGFSTAKSLVRKRIMMSDLSS